MDINRTVPKVAREDKVRVIVGGDVITVAYNETGDDRKLQFYHTKVPQEALDMVIKLDRPILFGTDRDGDTPWEDVDMFKLSLSILNIKEKN